MTTRPSDQLTTRPSDQLTTRPSDQLTTRPSDQLTNRPDDYLPLSMLNQLEYCERRFYLMHVLGEMEINAVVLEGTQQHERAHSPGASTKGDASSGLTTTTHRRVYVWNDRLQIAGYADVVEELACAETLRCNVSTGIAGYADVVEELACAETLRCNVSTGIAGYADVVEELAAHSALCPIEYKRGKMGRWLNDHVQLCAQAMCLEERTGTTIQQGCIFYFGSRRREPVELTPELRARTEAAVQRALAIVTSGVMPVPTDKRQKCHDCSLEPVCLPQEVEVLTGRRPVETRRRRVSKNAEADE